MPQYSLNTTIKKKAESGSYLFMWSGSDQHIQRLKTELTLGFFTNFGSVLREIQV
jgi:hypothetical protein